MVGSQKMGEVVVDVELENSVDCAIFARGHGEASDIRRSAVEAIVDTGPVMLVLPQNVVERLGVNILRTVVVTYADQRIGSIP